MALNIPSPDFIARGIQTPDILGAEKESAQLKNFLDEMALRKQLAPLQVQEAQQKVQTGNIDIQLKNMQLQGQRALADWLQNGDANAEVPAEKFSSNDKIATYVGVSPNDPIMSVVRSMAQHHVPTPMLMAEAKGMLERRQEYFKGTKEEQDAQKAERLVWQDALASLHETPQDQRSVALAAKLPLLTENSKTSPLLDAYAKGLAGHPELIDQAYNTLSAENAALGLRQKKAEALKADVEAKEAAAEATGQVTPKMATAQKQKIQLAREEAEARQRAAQGDPNVAGKMLADGSLTLADLKTRGTTPQFIEQATLAAQKRNPTYNPADEIIAEHIAKSPAANQFFGSANSLIGKGGTLDQLEALGKKIPQHDFPVLNTIDDWQKTASGKGPLAAYAAMALGVADDYGKVMGGGNASDHARDAALKLFSQAASPEQRADAVAATRGAVQSQRDSRIGKNQFLQRQYGTEVGGGLAAKTLSMSQIQQAAKDHGVSVDEAKRQAQAAGYKVQ